MKVKKVSVIQSIFSVIRNINYREFSDTINYCPFCNGKRPFIRLDADEIYVRCLICRSTPITLSLIRVLREVSPDLNSKNVYELSSRGSLVDYLKRKCKTLNCSEYFTDTIPGHYVNGVQCQDVQKLTYPDESFGLCTSTEVFEHIPDDAKGFSEIYRVLKADGIFIFTVPLDTNNQTVERASLLPGGEIKHLFSPEYHRDPIRSHEPILAFRNYGFDILDRLVDAGFLSAELRNPGNEMPWDYARTVIVDYKAKMPNNRLISDS